MEFIPIDPFLSLPHPARDGICGMPNVQWDPALLTKREQEIIIAAWDGDVIIDFQAKRFERGRVITVAVHNGDPHADDIGAVALLMVLLRGFQIRVFRTRDPQKLANADIRIDVGFGAFDHHGLRADKAHGISAITRIFFLLLNSLGDEYPRIVWERFADICDRIAASDVGLIEFTITPWVNDAVAAHRADPGWSADGDGSDTTEDGLFNRLVDRMYSWFDDVFRKAMAEHRATEAALADIAESGDPAYVVFSEDARQAPCKEILWKQGHTAWYFISPGRAGERWVVGCTCDPSGPFLRKSSWHLFPERLWGLEDAALEKAADLPKGTIGFVHADGFLAVLNSFEAAIKFVKFCLKEGGWGS